MEDFIGSVVIILGFILGFALVYIGIPILIAYLLYIIPKKLGYPKTGKYLAILSLLFITLFFLRDIFSDYLFTKADAKYLLAQEDITLTDQFEIEKIESGSDLHKGYLEFTLKISKNDKEKIISQIKQSAGFKEYNSEEAVPILVDSTVNRHIGPARMQNYALSKSFVIDYFRPTGEGHHAIYRTITINKKGDQLFFFELN